MPRSSRSGTAATIKTFGFVPRSDYNNNSSIYVGSQSGTQVLRQVRQGDVRVGRQVGEAAEWDKSLNDYYGGPAVQKFVGTYNGHSDDAKNALLSGAVAMEVDGEWHVGEIADENPSLDYGVAPVPVLDDVAEHLRRWQHRGHRGLHPLGLEEQGGCLLRPPAADDGHEFLTTLADTVFNIPSTFDSLKAWDKADDPHWAPLVKIFQNPGSYYKELTPAGDEDAATFGTFIQQYEQGKVSDLHERPGRRTAKKVDKLNAQAKG